MTANRIHTLADMLTVDPFERAMAKHEAMNDALCADLFGIVAGKQQGFNRLDAMRRQLLGEQE